MFQTDNSNLNKLSYGFAVLFLVIGGIQQYITAYFNDKGMMGMGFEILIIIYISILVANSFAPYFVNRFGSKKMMVAMCMLYIVSIIATTRDTEFIIYTGALLFGFAGAILWNSQHHYLINISNKDNLGSNSGYFIGIFSMGNLMGILSLGYLIDFVGYQNAFNVFIVIALISVFLFSRMESKDSCPEKGNKTSFASFKSRSLTLLAMTSSMLPNIILALMFSLMPIHIQTISNSPYLIGLVSAVYFVIMMLLSKKFGSLSDTVGRGNMIISGLLLALLGLGILAFAENIAMLIVGAIFMSIANSILVPMSNAIQGDISTVENRSLVTSSFMFFKYIGIILGLLLGYLLTISLTYITSIVVMLTVLVLAYTLLMRISDMKEQIASELEPSPITKLA